MASRKGYWKFIVVLFAVVFTCFCECGSQKTDTVHTETCFIYTDGLLDDLCAIEYLAGHYDHSVIMLQDPNGLIFKYMGKSFGWFCWIGMA